MDDNGQRENGRHKQDHYKSLHAQWIIPPHLMILHQMWRNYPHLMKDHHALTMKLMNILAERDAAIQERNIAISEKKAAFAERDVAIMQRDQAITERNNALMERENALAALEYRDNSHVNGGNASTCPPGCGIPRGTKHIHHPQQVHHSSNMNEAHYNSRDMHVTDALPVSVATKETEKPGRAKRMKEAKALPLKKSSRPSKKRKNGNEDMSKQVTVAKLNDWKNGQCLNDTDEDLNKQLPVSKPDWKNHDLGLNQVAFDEFSMPPPGCSCTGTLQQCYKWGKGGWQSACCTMTLSCYPLPVMANKRHARLGGRKMSGSAFTKLLSRLAAEGHDLSTPLDLKDHWAKHGTNRYITIK